ncbi:hypothetical protein AYO21_10664 [Fonsecaea monophora]|uniref:Uncharacterized protein n=1 Tax=Fonsecaea monophora TaxID=254056 RepID=A0A177EU52_9EURO|nr:hypothetical protein AYO21_10664 [Fonsecaea monophora]KAH0832522.1 hypothetical protein FOPE_01196 [Fonsecaea pedrosoi]OAG35146.1 hypothetical protein AYO21_10664 [Fonsecaea monophora]
MSAPRQSSPLSADVEIPCSIVAALRDTSDIKAQGAASDKVLRMDTIQEEWPEAEHDIHCLPCLHVAGGATQIDDGTSPVDQSAAVPEYVLKIREAIKLQGQRLQKTPCESEQQEKHESAGEKLNSHIKISSKRKRASLLSSATERGRNVVSEVKSRSKRLSTVFIMQTKHDSASAEVTSEQQKRRPLPLVVEEVERPSVLTSQPRRMSAIFSPMRSKLPEQDKEKPKIKSKPRTPIYRGAGENNSTTQNAESIKKPYADNVEYTDSNSDDDGEDVGLLSLRRSGSSQSQSFDASHFYTPMVPAGSRRGREYRIGKTRFSHVIDSARKLASRSARGVRHNVGDTLKARGRGRGWSKLKI